uniref:Small ribosomal subunit protein uS2c n=1 Tax=Stigeoclonium helveticum TaxID=55999 RepID=RR2_STIHE|nr:ribosomal protein S2 [Stigeoclonium helveticum]Q06SH8.1 RecName: Full=Small ribosomal subunit protein uS2c; AltName: Full=30S ribosomal protein S2, chloroplastic [Stigeoclonium helveticum]ABF60196.1 ribosomal protein S2 [Stigeoclonium helveticum]
MTLSTNNSKNDFLDKTGPVSILGTSKGKKALLRRRLLIIQNVRNILIKKIINFDNFSNPIETYKIMLRKSLHFGHPVIQCDSGMKKYIRGQSNGKHFINLFRTKRYIRKALWYLTKYAYKRKNILFVGTAIPSARYVATTALKTKSFFVNFRWLGGMLNNWKTLRKLLQKLKTLQKEQKNKIWKNLPKKEGIARLKEKQRLEKYLKGIQMIKGFPEVVIMTSQTKDLSAARECKKMGIWNLSILDTNCDPRLADLMVPANDDSASSVKFLLFNFAKAIQAGRALSVLKKKLKNKLTKKKQTKSRAKVFLKEKKL